MSASTSRPRARKCREQLVAHVRTASDLDVHAVGQRRRPDLEHGAVGRAVDASPIRTPAPSGWSRARQIEGAPSGRRGEVDHLRLLVHDAHQQALVASLAGVGFDQSPAARPARPARTRRRSARASTRARRDPARPGRAPAARRWRRRAPAALTTKRPAYHRRQPQRERARAATHASLEDIADAAHGVEELGLEVLVDLLAQPVHEDVDGVGAGVEAVVPHVRHDHGLRHHLAGMTHQVLEQRELARAQFDRAPLPRSTRRVRRSRRRSATVSSVDSCAHLPASRQRLHAREQLREGEGLGEVVVAARLQALDAIVDRVAGAQEQHGRLHARATQRRDEAEAVEPRQHDVDDRGVVGLRSAPGRGRRRRCRATSTA